MAFPHKYLFSQDTRCEWASRAAASPLRALRTRLHSGLERMGGTSPCAHQAPMPPPGTGQDAAPEAWQNRAPGTLLSPCTSSPARETRATQPGLILPLLCKYQFYIHFSLYCWLQDYSKQVFKICYHEAQKLNLLPPTASQHEYQTKLNHVFHIFPLSTAALRVTFKILQTYLLFLLKKDLKKDMNISLTFESALRIVYPVPHFQWICLIFSVIRSWYISQCFLKHLFSLQHITL